MPSGPWRGPVEVEFAVRRRTVPQVQVDEALVRDAHFLGDRLEIRDRLFVETDGDLLLQLRCVWVLPRSGEVVLFAHVVTPLRIGLGFLGRREVKCN